MYAILLHYNTNYLYQTSCFDTKYVTISIASLLRPQESRENIQISPDDPRMEFIRRLFQQRVQNDVVRMAWFENQIANINLRILQQQQK